MTVRMLQRRGTYAEWQAVASTLVLQEGEVGYETTSGKFKIGDGDKTWSELEYVLPDNQNELKYPQLATDNTFTGDQEVGGELTVDGNISSLSDVSVGADLTVFGNITSGQIDVTSHKIIGLSDPTAQSDAANKQYVDQVAQGLAIKPAVHAATISNLSGTYTNGTAGVGAQINLGPLSTLNIDGETTWSRFDGVLVKDQTNAPENGRYYVDQVGSGSTDWILTRCGYCDTATEIASAYVYVQGGSTLSSTGWVASVGDLESFVVGTSDIDWIQFSGAGTYLAGDGLDINGTEFSAVGTASRISVSSSGIDIDSNYAGQPSIDTVGEIVTGTWSADTISIEHGGTGATTASGARDNLGLGDSAVLDLGTTAGTVAEGNHNHNDIYYTKTLTDEILGGYVHTASSSTIAGTLTANNYNIAVSAEASDNVTFDFSGGTGLSNRIAGGTVTVFGSNYAAGAIKTLVINNSASGSARTLAFPSGWVFLGTKPTTIAANKVGVLTVTSMGNSEASCIAGWAVQN